MTKTVHRYVLQYNGYSRALNLLLDSHIALWSVTASRKLGGYRPNADPFDRMLTAQARVEARVLLMRDAAAAEYCERVKLVRWRPGSPCPAFRGGEWRDRESTRRRLLR